MLIIAYYRNLTQRETLHLSLKQWYTSRSKILDSRDYRMTRNAKYSKRRDFRDIFFKACTLRYANIDQTRIITNCIYLY